MPEPEQVFCLYIFCRHSGITERRRYYQQRTACFFRLEELQDVLDFELPFVAI